MFAQLFVLYLITGQYCGKSWLSFWYSDLSQKSRQCNKLSEQPTWSLSFLQILRKQRNSFFSTHANPFTSINYIWSQKNQITPGWSCIWEVSRGKDIFDTNQKFQMLCQEGLLESFVSGMKDFHTILAVKKKATGENRTLKSDPEVSHFKRIVLLSKFPKSRPSQFSCLWIEEW